MTGIPSYSTTPANNVAANTGITWDEGMSPASVNNSARQNMTDMRLAFNDLIWFQYTTGSQNTTLPLYGSATTFTIAATDVTAAYHVGRRIKAVGSSTGTIYGSISATVFSTNTTVTVAWDSGSLSNEALTIYLSQIPITGSPVGRGALARNAYYSSAGFNRTQTSGAFMSCGFGSSWALTPKSTGRIKIAVTGWTVADSAATIIEFAPFYGTGSAPSAGSSGGSQVGPEQRNAGNSTSSTGYAFHYYGELSGLTLGTAYWFDMQTVNGLAGGGTMTVSTVLIEEF